MLMAAMLHKAIREGTGAAVHSVYGVKIPLAGKTGTSQNYADAWFAAFNPGIVIVSRVGASTPSIHFNNGSYGSGSALALPLVAMTLRKVEKEKELMNRINIPFEPLPPNWQWRWSAPTSGIKHSLTGYSTSSRKRKSTTARQAKGGALSAAGSSDGEISSKLHCTHLFSPVKCKP
jgi:membrane carboxypeptidase/penicillin-binding protein